jgi:hypothetical protein
VKLLGDHAAQPAGAYLLSPWLDLTQSGEAYEVRGPHDPMVTREALQMMAKLYCGDAEPTEPLISPLNADLAGLPPLLIQVGGNGPEQISRLRRPPNQRHTDCSSQLGEKIKCKRYVWCSPRVFLDSLVLQGYLQITAHLPARALT